MKFLIKTVNYWNNNASQNIIQFRFPANLQTNFDTMRLKTDAFLLFVHRRTNSIWHLHFVWVSAVAVSLLCLCSSDYGKTQWFKRKWKMDPQEQCRKKENVSDRKVSGFVSSCSNKMSDSFGLKIGLKGCDELTELDRTLNELSKIMELLSSKWSVACIHQFKSDSHQGHVSTTFRTAKR